MQNSINFEHLSDLEKAIFMYAYYSIMNDMIYEKWNALPIGKEKDNELLRWRFANNELGVYKLPLLEQRMQYLVSYYENENKKQNSSSEKLSKIFDELDSVINAYQWGFLDLRRIKEEKEDFSTGEVDFDDLNVDFEGAKTIFLNMDEETKDKIVKKYNIDGVRHNILTFDIIKNPKKPSSLDK